MLIENIDQRSKDYSKIQDKFRPAHADYSYWKKYGIRDYRGGGRASARETAMRVAAGAVAKKFLKEACGTQIIGYLSQLGPICIETVDFAVIEENPFFCPDPTKITEMESYITMLSKEGTTSGHGSI